MYCLAVHRLAMRTGTPFALAGRLLALAVAGAVLCPALAACGGAADARSASAGGPGARPAASQATSTPTPSGMPSAQVPTAPQRVRASGGALADVAHWRAALEPSARRRTPHRQHRQGHDGAGGDRGRRPGQGDPHPKGRPSVRSEIPGGERRPASWRRAHRRANCSRPCCFSRPATRPTCWRGPTAPA